MIATETAHLNRQLAQVGSDPRWTEWLAYIDPATGFRRQQLLDEGLETNNSVRVTVLLQQSSAHGHLGYWR